MRTIRQFYFADRCPIAGGTAIPLSVVRRLLSPMPADLCGCWHFGSPRTGPASDYSLVPWKDASGRKVAIGAHRLSFLWFHGPIPEGKMVLHRCNSKGCFNPAHLYAGTDLDNARDRADYERTEAAAGRVTAGARMRAAMKASAARRRALACEAIAA